MNSLPKLVEIVMAHPKRWNHFSRWLGENYFFDHRQMNDGGSRWNALAVLEKDTIHTPQPWRMYVCREGMTMRSTRPASVVER